MSAHVVEVARGFRETRKAPKLRTLPEFAQFTGKSLWACWRFLEGVLTIPPDPPLGMDTSQTCQLGALSNGMDTYSWRTLAGVHPCLYMLSRSTGGIFGKRGKCGKFWGFRNFRRNPYGAFWHFLERFVKTPPAPIRGRIFPTRQLGALSNERVHIPGESWTCTSMSAHFVDGARWDFARNAESVESAASA